MSQNPFGAAAPGAEPAPLPAEPVETEKSHKGLLIGGVAGLVALVAAGGAFLVLSGDEDMDAAALAAPRAPVASSTTTEPPAPLPTLAEFNGRNPFKAKIVEGTGGGGGDAAAVPAGSTAAPTSAPGTGGAVGGSTGGTSVVRSGGSGGGVVFVPGPTVTKTVDVPGPTTTETVEVPGPTETVFLEPGNITLTFLGYDLADVADDDPLLPDFQVNDWILADVGDDPATPEDEAIFAYYFKLLGVDTLSDGTERARLQFGDDLVWVDQGATKAF